MLNSLISFFAFLNQRSALKLGRVSDLTQILERVEKGDGKAGKELLPLVYQELRKLAAARMTREMPGKYLEGYRTGA